MTTTVQQEKCKPVLIVDDVHATVADKAILRGVSLQVLPGEVHVIMGPNGSGKSTLANLMVGHPDYTLDSGKIVFLDKDLLSMAPHERALAGLFMAFQYPIALPGVSTLHFLHTVINQKRKHQGEMPLDAFAVLSLVEAQAKMVGIDVDFLQRPLNEGFSGGEKKRHEILQMLLLEPALAVLDETDSGLDIDALADVMRCVESCRDGARSFIIVTHYQRMLRYIKPDYVHVMAHGRIQKSGGEELAQRLEHEGYAWLESE